MKEVQKDWTIEQFAPYLKNYRQILTVGNDTQMNHLGPKTQRADWMKDSTTQAISVSIPGKGIIESLPGPTNPRKNKNHPDKAQFHGNLRRKK